MIAKIVGETTGGHCSRAKTSPMALWHLDIYTSIIYEFAVKMLNLRGQEAMDRV